MDSGDRCKRICQTVRDFPAFLSNKFSIELYPENTANNFICDLRDPIPLYGHWTVAVLDIFFQPTFVIFTSTPVYILCNFCAESPAKVGTLHHNSVLRRINLSGSGTFSHHYSRPLYIPVNVSVVNRLRFQIVMEDGKPLALTGDTHLALQFLRNE